MTTSAIAPVYDLSVETIYLDSLFALNAVIDYFLLALLARGRRGRCCAAGGSPSPPCWAAPGPWPCPAGHGLSYLCADEARACGIHGAHRLRRGAAALALSRHLPRRVRGLRRRGLGGVHAHGDGCLRRAGLRPGVHAGAGALLCAVLRRGVAGVPAHRKARRARDTCPSW